MTTLLGCVLLLSACGSAGTGVHAPPVADPATPQPTTTAISAAPSPTVGGATAPTLEPPATPLPVVTQQKETPMLPPDQASESVRPALPYNAQPLTPPFGTAIDVQIDAAKQDLAQRLGIDASVIEVVEIDAVTWPDTSLGCPKSGMMYPQVLVDGILVQLRANGQVYRYHGDGQSRLFLCDTPGEPLGD